MAHFCAGHVEFTSALGSGSGLTVSSFASNDAGFGATLFSPFAGAGFGPAESFRALGCFFGSALSFADGAFISFSEASSVSSVRSVIAAHFAQQG
ncbi:MAG: hypothetical protein IPJ88_18845 [Myxococcales bacterium]|nr:MAG: hypothetical protein IPJ88_18845 [Myxococcales bacterium]